MEVHPVSDFISDVLCDDRTRIWTRS